MLLLLLVIKGAVVSFLALLLPLVRREILMTSAEVDVLLGVLGLLCVFEVDDL